MDPEEELSTELDRLAFEAEVARDIRRRLTTRLAAVVVAANLLAAAHVLPWLAGGVTAAMSAAAVGGVVGIEKRAQHRLLQSRLTRYLPQTDTRPTVR